MANTPEQDLHTRIKTAYQLARAATATYEGRKAIDFFYHVHLNSYPGIAHGYLPKAEVEAAIGHYETMASKLNTEDVKAAQNALRADIREKLGLKKG